MFLLLLIAVLTGCQQFSGHCPVGNTVLCPLWRKAPGTKKQGTGALSLYLRCHRRAWGGELHVTRCGGGVLWHDRVFKISMQSSHEESGGCGVSWGKWLNFCSTALFLDTDAHAVAIRQGDTENVKLLSPGCLSSLHWYNHLNIACFQVKYFNYLICGVTWKRVSIL